MQRINKVVSTVFGIGYFPFGPGTLAAALATIAWYGVALNTGNTYWQILTIIASATLGIYCSGQLSKETSKDPSYVVIDELVGMWVALLFIPPTIANYTIAFLLFRFFDIVKPLGIRRMENQKKGWGIMMDDLLAGIYSNFALRIIIELR